MSGLDDEAKYVPWWTRLSEKPAARRTRTDWENVSVTTHRGRESVVCKHVKIEYTLIVSLLFFFSACLNVTMAIAGSEPTRKRHRLNTLRWLWHKTRPRNTEKDLWIVIELSYFDNSNFVLFKGQHQCLYNVRIEINGIPY